MRSLLQFVVLGLTMGSTYALFAQGAVLIHRGSGVVNFAHGAVGSLAAYVTFVDLVDERGWPAPLAIGAGVLFAAGLSMLFDLAVLRRLRLAAPLVQVIATVALLGLVHAVIVQRFGIALHPVDAFLPTSAMEVGGVRIQHDRLIVFGLSAAITLALWIAVRSTRAGLAMEAAAENSRAVRTLGWSTDRLAVLTWGVGGGLGGLAAILVAPLTGLTPTAFTLVVSVSGLGAALLGQFRSFPMTFAGGLLIGVGEALATHYRERLEDALGGIQLSGLHRAPALLVIVGALVVRGTGLPARSHVGSRLPRIGAGLLDTRRIVYAFSLVTFALLMGLAETWTRALTASLTIGVMALSVVVLTGYAGQLSLAQWSIGGIGALIAARLVVETSLPIELALVAGVVGTVPIGALIALPALRTRGVDLAVVTLALGYLITQMVFNNRALLGPRGRGEVGAIELFGIPVDALDHSRRWAFVCLCALALTGVFVANLRRSPTGRRLLAVRSNERAAASLGISVAAVKVYAFSVAAGIAALGSVLVAFQFRNIGYSRFGVFESVQGVGDAVVGGVGFALAGVFSVANTGHGLGARVVESALGDDDMATVIGSALVLVVLLAAPDGIAGAVTRFGGRHRRRTQSVAATPLGEAGTARVVPATLTIREATVQFGAVTALAGASLDVGPGEVVGLIGPNGAGKTTLIDAVTGFVTLAGGEIALGGRPMGTTGVDERARWGMRRSFQSVELFDELTIEENIRTGVESSPWWRWVADPFRPRSGPLPGTAVAAIREFGLTEHLGAMPEELPAGLRRLAAIARTVASGPSVVLLDEPAAGLDETESAELSRLIRRMADVYGMGVLLVEHDVGLVLSTCDRVVVLDFGRVIAAGPPDVIRNDPEVVSAYLG